MTTTLWQLENRLAKESRKNKLSSRKPMPDYCVGQHVLILKVIPTNDGKSKKLLQKYSGPYEIKKILDSDRFLITDIPGATRSQRFYEGVVPGGKIKPYVMNTGSNIESSDDSDE
jgi:hypothetical protein